MFRCDYWYSREYWSRLGERCEQIVNKYGNDIVLPTEPHNDPLEVFKVSAPANFAHFRYYTDIQCKSIIYMLDNNIVLWSIRNKNSENIIRQHHSIGVNLITPWGCHGKRKIQISPKLLSLWEKWKCNTNMDVKSNNPVFDQDTAKRNTPCRGQFSVL